MQQPAFSSPPIPLSRLPTKSPLHCKSHQSPLHPSRNLAPRHACPVMIQRPDAEGPPNLDTYLDSSRRTDTQSAPVTLGTGRALLSKHANDATATALAALALASDGLAATPHLCHLTTSLDVDATAVAAAVAAKLGSTVPLIGRSVNKKDSAGTVELLLLRSEAPGAIAVASASVPVAETDAEHAVATAAREAARSAAVAALAKLDANESCTFMLFSHSPGAPPAEARAGLDAACNGVIAYGGPAVGHADTGLGWSLIGGTDATALVRNDDFATMQTAVVAAVPGSLSFLFSAVIKTWAQPAYTESLSYMTPNYIDDPEIDLLTAIRYNDWAKFTWCIEEKGVDVNIKWVNKQNQIPLLAACARARTEMIKYLIDNGADVHHRNDGGFTAAMYTRMLTEYDDDLVQNQLRMLEEAGLSTKLTAEEAENLKKATSGRIVE